VPLLCFSFPCASEEASKKSREDKQKAMSNTNLQSVRFALVCASNQNRSMEAHSRLLKNGFNVCSYGTGAHVKLPGPARDKPNIFSFGTPYKQIYEELKEQNYNLYVSSFICSLKLTIHRDYRYKQNGVLNMLERNMKVKNAPEQWQQELTKKFHVVVTFEKRVYDTVYEGL